MVDADIEHRRSRIGASDVAKIVGLSPFGDAMSVWLDKLGLIDPAPQSDEMAIGLLIEDVIAELYTRRTNIALYTPHHDIRHPQHEWLGGHPDRFSSGTMADILGVELKNVGLHQAHRWGEPETDQVPQEYLIQCAMYMAICDIDRWDVAPLIGGQDFRIYSLVRDRELEDMLIEHCRHFWFEQVLCRTPPELTGSSASKAYLERQYANHSRDLRLSTLELDGLAYSLRDVKASLAADLARKDYLENCLKLAIGDARGIQGVDYRITWTADKHGHRRFLAQFDKE